MNQNYSNPIPNILRLREVISRVGLKRSSIYLAMEQGHFPKAIKLGERSVGWLEDEITSWIAQRIAASRTPAQITLK